MENVHYRLSARAVAVAVIAVIIGGVGMPPIAAAAPSCLGIPATIVGTPNGEALVGTPGPDVIVGLGGDDTIQALGGDDRICGGDGDDVLLGGPGDDDIAGGRGNDLLYGMVGNDGLYGGSGDDISRGGVGDDYIYSWTGDDRNHGGRGGNAIIAGPGNDRLVAGQLGDRLSAGPGNDTVIGGKGGDVVIDDGGDDLIRLRGGDDIAFAFDGDDKVFGGSGNDLLAGMSGNDRLGSGDGTDLVIGGAGQDKVRASTGFDLCDKDGRETPRGCEETKELFYRTVTVQTKGTGTDPTGSGFGDRFFNGAQVDVSIYQADFFPEYLENAMPVASATMRGSEFTVSVPVADYSIGIIKTFPSWDLALGEVTSASDAPSPLQATLDCCEHFGPPWESLTGISWGSTTFSADAFDLGRPFHADMTE